MFVTDAAYNFSTDSELLQDVSQFNLSLRNMILSANLKYASNPGLESFTAQVTEELNCYKAYDV